MIKFVKEYEFNEVGEIKEMKGIEINNINNGIKYLIWDRIIIIMEKWYKLRNDKNMYEWNIIWMIIKNKCMYWSIFNIEY